MVPKLLGTNLLKIQPIFSHVFLLSTYVGYTVMYSSKSITQSHKTFMFTKDVPGMLISNHKNMFTAEFQIYIKLDALFSSNFLTKYRQNSKKMANKQRHIANNATAKQVFMKQRRLRKSKLHQKWIKGLILSELVVKFRIGGGGVCVLWSWVPLGHCDNITNICILCLWTKMFESGARIFISLELLETHSGRAEFIIISGRLNDFKYFEDKIFFFLPLFIKYN